MIIGKRISGRYKILDMVGGGGMANVYLAHDMILDRDVAVKMLRLDFANDEEFIRRFHREAQSATSLVHPNIVSIYDVGEEDGLYYIVMEYVDGQTLKQYIQQNAPVPIEKAIDIMKQLTSAIAHAHQNHIIHRDIKPHNILVDDEGNVKITDFGIAMALSATSITQTNSVLGSVHYLSPEQARGGMANKKSDIYSIGIVMFELLTGRLPFSGESAVSIALKHLQSETPSLRRWNPSIPQSVENIVLRATAKDPFHRYDDVYEMEEDLRTALDPSRLNEKKFSVPIDNDATKAIPVITDDRPISNLDETLVHGTETDGQDASGSKDVKKKAKKKNKNKKKKKWPIVLAVSLFSIAILAVLAFIFLPDLMGPKDKTVPDVSGKEVEEAMEDLMSAGFVIDEKKKVPNEDIEEGKIIKTSPEAGSTAKEGANIDLYISSGKKKFKLGDYRGRSIEDVERLLNKKDFKDIVKTEENDESAPGTILDQYPSGGEEVIPDETELEFIVSKGPDLIVLKDLTGFNEKGVQDYGETEGLAINVNEEYSENVEEGLVIRQDPAPGTSLQKNSRVTVVISKGKETLPPKTVYEEITIPYDPEMDGAPQEVQIFIEDADRSMTEPAETFKITGPTKKRLEFRIEPGQKAGYKVIRDNTVILEDVKPYPED
ncbi:Stk1 family PASTA domain-containing Ser/Thr kinase [Mesobacillus zeae]|uniref:Serine/threonine-protein kinase PrkC n=1 Tax=Mesobacillus zeae TaxID=1917180 RepID=A0A398BJN0_9BACI|nr:Stk1 family PASTA domain-containing Ser/Thr kinase [Mesobacillus zeae]RID87950.1 Stk1 family PASTA domain-containing Ser/Thr kinase [Mesobacillus zeae]